MKTFQAAAACLAFFFAVTTAKADVTVSFGTGSDQFDMEFVRIGNPGNIADETGDPRPAGSVSYVYRLGKFEVSRDMVAKANAAGGLEITLDSMENVPGGPRLQMPATSVSWNEAARFANWLNASQGFPSAYKFEVHPGDAGYSANANIQLWQPGDPGYDAANPFRNRLAKYFLPSFDEWYKAAYYDPTANEGAGGYWNYPTGSDLPPAPAPGGTAPNTAVYSRDFPYLEGPADIDQAGGLSPYGVMGLGGNVIEWDETELDLVNDNPAAVRELRGGGWAAGSFYLVASFRGYHVPWEGASTIGFRVAASVPEPATGLPAAFGLSSIMMWRRRSIQAACVKR